MHVFHMAKKAGEMSRGEKNFVLCCAGISLIAFMFRTFTLRSFADFLIALWRAI